MKIYIIILWFIAILVERCNMGNNYINHKLENVCLSNVSKIRIKLHNDVHVFSLNSSTYPYNTLDCHLEMVVPSSNFGFSVFIEQMSLGGSLAGCREDYLQFSRDILFVTTHASRKYCGIVELPVSQNVDGVNYLTFTTTPLANRVYSEESDQDLDVWLHVDNILGDRTVPKSLTMVVTPYQKSCNDQDGEYVSCINSATCVKRDLFCDGRVNCPGHHGHPADEAECHHHDVDQDDLEDFWTWQGLAISIFLLGMLVIVLICTSLGLKKIMNTSKVTECSTQRRQLEELLAADFLPQISSCPYHEPPPYLTERQFTSHEQPELPTEPPRYELLWE